MLAGKDFARCIDPVLLAGEAGIEQLDPWQRDALNSASKRILMCCCRQSGKTEVAVLRALHTSLYDPGLVVIVSPSQRQSAETFRRFMERYRALEGVPEIVAESVLRCELSNSSRLIALPGSERTLRGLASVRLAIIDEAARCDPELYAAIRPMLGVSAGSLIMLSTPCGQVGEFYRAWFEGGSVWTRVKVDASQCPRLSPEFLAEERAQLGDALYRQEYELEFLTDSESVFDLALFKQAFERGAHLEAFF